MPRGDHLPFSSYVAKRDSGCWEWTGYTTRDGYGRVTANRRTRLAHRRAWELERGPIPAGAYVLHSCDNRLCVNPEHLRLGTNAENMADMVARGRAARGTRSAGAKLTDAQAREALDSKEPARLVAARFGVSASTIAMIRAGLNWRHLRGGGR